MTSEWISAPRNRAAEFSNPRTGNNDLQHLQIYFDTGSKKVISPHFDLFEPLVEFLEFQVWKTLSQFKIVLGSNVIAHISKHSGSSGINLSGKPRA
jgi:hypothetical protein